MTYVTLWLPHLTIMPFLFILFISQLRNLDLCNAPIPLVYFSILCGLPISIVFIVLTIHTRCLLSPLFYHCSRFFHQLFSAMKPRPRRGARKIRQSRGTRGAEGICMAERWPVESKSTLSPSWLFPTEKGRSIGEGRLTATRPDKSWSSLGHSFICEPAPLD